MRHYTRIALNPAGALPYFSERYAYDMLGLTNKRIAHRSVAGFGEGLVGHDKGDGCYIFNERPAIILLGNITVVNQLPAVLTDVQWKVFGRSERELVDIPELTVHYVPDALPLSDGRFVCFLRRADFHLVGSG